MKNCEIQDGKGLDCEKRIPREERPEGSQRQVPHRGGEEGKEEAQCCRMAPEEPKAKVISAALPSLERCICVQAVGLIVG